MTYTRKTKDIYLLMANYGYGWEVETQEETFILAKEQKKTYILNAPEYAYRVEIKRELIEVSK